MLAVAGKMGIALGTGEACRFGACPQGCQLVQRIPAHGVDGGGAEHQSRLYGHMDPGAQIRRAAGLAQPGRYLLGSDTLVHSSLWHRAPGSANTPLRVGDGETAFLAVDCGLHLHSYQPCLCAFIALAHLLQPVLIFLGVLPDAKHSLSCGGGIIAVSKALAVKGIVQNLQHRPGHIAALQRFPVYPGDRSHIFRALHAALQLHRCHAHGIQVLQIVHKAVVF